MNYCKSDFGQKCLINALNVTVNVNLHLTPPEPWECALYNQLSYLSQDDLLDPNQSGFRTQLTPLRRPFSQWLGAARASSLSSVLILLDLSSMFDTVKPNPALHSGWTLNRWLCSNLVHIIPDKPHFSGHMEWLLVQTMLSGNWCPSRLSIRTTSVFTIH